MADPDHTPPSASSAPGALNKIHPAVKLWRMSIFLDGEQGMDADTWFARLTQSDPGRRYFGRVCSQFPEYHDKLWAECSPDLKRFHARQEFMHDTGMSRDEAAPAVAPSQQEGVVFLPASSLPPATLTNALSPASVMPVSPTPGAPSVSLEAMAERNIEDLASWRPMSEEPLSRPITARKRLDDGSWWYARVRAWRYQDGDGGRFGDHGYELLHYNGAVTVGRFYGPFDGWCEIGDDLVPVPTAPLPSAEAMADALRPFADAADVYRWPDHEDGASVGDDSGVTLELGDLRRAAAILARLQPDARPEAAGSGLGEAVRAHLTLADIAERIDNALEGECDGLSIDESEARRIAAYALTGIEESPEQRIMVDQALDALSRIAPPSRGADQGGDRG